MRHIRKLANYIRTYKYSVIFVKILLCFKVRRNAQPWGHETEFRRSKWKKLDRTATGRFSGVKDDK